MSAALDLALIDTGLSYVSFAPFTKVEESFNLHATHDVLMYMYGVGAANLPEVRDVSLVYLGSSRCLLLVSFVCSTPRHLTGWTERVISRSLV